MRTTYGFRGMAALAALCMSASWVSAATIDVPGDHATIQDAIAAASAGDTIMITDSGTYQTSLFIDKPLIIEAWPGQNPTITNIDDYAVTGLDMGSGFEQFAHIDVVTTESGTRIGSVNGGTINFVHDQTSDGDNTGFPYLLNMHEFTPDATMENVFVTTIPGGGDKMRLFRDDWSSTLPRVLNLTRFEYDDAQNGGDGQTSEVIRMGAPNLTVNIDESKFYNLGGGLIVQAIGTDFNITNSVLDARGGERAVYTRLAEITIEDSILIGNSSNGVVQMPSSQTEGDLTVSHSVVASTGTRGLNLQGDGFSVLVDHSDIIIDEAAGDFEAVRVDGGTTRSIEITNSNVVGLSAGTETPSYLVNIVTDPSDVGLTLDHNNYFAPGWTDLLSTDAAAADTNSQNIDPDYVSGDPIEGDVSYNDATLKISDDAGEPIGVDGNLLETVPVELSTFEVM